MDGTETEFAQQWGAWLTAQLKTRKWKGADLRRAILAAGGTVGVTQVSRWINGEQRPSVQGARAVADALGVDRREAYTIAGRHEALDENDGPIVVTEDPVEWFIRRIKARRFPKEIEERLIDEILREIRQRQSAYDATLDIVETVSSAGESPGPKT
jgi:hypothetical protein